MNAPITELNVERIERSFVKPFRNAKVHMRSLSYVRVTVAAGGVTGQGEMTAMPGYSSETIASMKEAIAAHFAPAVRGLDALDASRIEDAMALALPGNPYARSAVELALWDLRGRLLNAPVYKLLGGAVRETVPIGAIVVLDEPAAMAEDARHWAAKGAGTFQVKIAGDAASSAARVRAVREAVGPQAVIAVDGNGSFTRASALQAMEAIAPYGVAFFEQPLPVADFAGMAALVRERLVPVVADECLVTPADALRLVSEGAADGFNLKLAKSGIAGTRHIMAIADAAGIPYGLGAMLETRFGTQAGIHVGATMRSPLFAAELVGPWKVQDGEVPDADLEPGQFAWKLPEGPGWGTPR
jgi:muconate cycloisomerase